MVTVTETETARAPAPSSGKEAAASARWIFGLEILMLFCYVVIVLFYVLRTLARRSSPLHFVLTIASRLSIPIITYTISTAEDAKGSTSPLFVVSAVFLHLLYSKIIAETGERDFFKEACRAEIWNKLFPVAEVAGLVWIGFLLLSSTENALRKRLKIPTCIVIGLTIIQVVLYYFTLDFATSSFALGKNPKLVRSYMAKDNTFHSDPSKLLVTGEEKQTIKPEQTGGYSIVLTKEKDFITLDKVLAYCDQQKITITDEERIDKELCTSVALFKVLVGQYYLTGPAQLDDRSSYMIIETQRFVRRLLLGKDVNYESTFRVIERELAFLGDYLYSTLPVAHLGWFPYLHVLLLFFLLVCCLSMIVIIIVACCFIDVPGTFLHDFYKKDRGDDDPYKNYPRIFYLDVLVCLFILMGPVGMEAWEIFTYFSSDWVRVSLFCKQVKHFHQPKEPSRIQIALRHHCFFEGIRHLCNTRGYLRCLRSKKLNQRSIPSSTTLKPVKVPEIVKQTMFTYLQENTDIALDVEELADVWKLEGHTNKLLVLHIVTSLCEDDAATKSIVNSPDYQVASCLSRYCGYLVTARPELISNDEPEWISEIVLDVPEHFGPNNDVCKEDGPSPTAKPLADMGKELRDGLMDEKVDEKRRWAILASIWMKMVLHLAASNDVKAHISTLSHDDGEFITHVWALLYHIGNN